MALSFRLDWSQNHLFNALWHPHARFHGAFLLFMLAGVAISSLWSMWRPSLEPEGAIRMAALLSLAFWTPLIYITSVLPRSSSWAGPVDTDPRLTGSLVTPNVVVALGFVAGNLVVLWLFRHGEAAIGKRLVARQPPHPVSE